MPKVSPDVANWSYTVWPFSSEFIALGAGARGRSRGRGRVCAARARTGPCAPAQKTADTSKPAPQPCHETQYLNSKINSKSDRHYCTDYVRPDRIRMAAFFHKRAVRPRFFRKRRSSSEDLPSRRIRSGRRDGGKLRNLILPGEPESVTRHFILFEQKELEIDSLLWSDSVLYDSHTGTRAIR